MIVVRDIFYLKFGKAKDAKALMPEAEELSKKYGFNNTRALTDLVTGHSYTLVFESTWDSLSAWENSAKTGMGEKDWQAWYAKFVPLIDSSFREILTIL
jgi:hypothetical protein